MALLEFAGAKQRHGRINLSYRLGQARPGRMYQGVGHVSGAATGERREHVAAASFGIGEHSSQNTGQKTGGAGDGACRMEIRADAGPRKRLVFDDFVVQSVTRPCVGPAAAG